LLMAALSPSKASHRIWILPRESVVVHLGDLAVDADAAFGAVAFVELGVGEGVFRWHQTGLGWGSRLASSRRDFGLRGQAQQDSCSRMLLGLRS
jgi:hypothetical protein